MFCVDGFELSSTHNEQLWVSFTAGYRAIKIQIYAKSSSHQETN